MTVPLLPKTRIDKTAALIQKQKYVDENNKYKIITNNLSRKQPEKSKALSDDKSLSFGEQKIDANEVLQSLNSQSEHLVKHLLGEPNQCLSNKTQYRYGAKGSFAVNLSNGLWHSFETGEGGNLFGLIQQEKGFSSFKEALDYAVCFTKLKPSFIPITPLNTKENSIVNVDVTDEGLRKTAIKLYNSSKSIKGSIVEKYLTLHRGLYQTKNADLRYCPYVYSKINDKHINTPALLAFARNEHGEINHIQITKLDENTANKNKLFKSPKQTFGKINGHAVNLNNSGEGDVTYLTEGVETGLSILEINPKARVFTVLGKENFAKINLKQLTKDVVLCIDNDGKETFKYQNNGSNKIIAAIDRLQGNGIGVNIILPKNHGQDLNDILLHSGKKELAKALNKTITPAEYKNLCDKENNILPKISKAFNEINTYNYTKDTNLIVNIKKTEFMGSDLIERIKDQAMNQKIRSNHIDMIRTEPRPIISQKEMEKEL